MVDRYRVDRSFGGGYTVRQTALADEVLTGALVLRAIALALVSDLDQALAEVNNVIAELPHETAYPARGDISARSIRLPSRWAKVC